MTSDVVARMIHAASYPDEYFAALQLASDPLITKIDSNTKAELINAALLCGKQTAAGMVSAAESALPSEIALHLGISLAKSDLPGTRVVLSRCDPNRKRIALNRSVVTELERAICDCGLQSLSSRASVAEVAIAHELFHCIEADNPAIFSRSYRISLWKLGPFSYRSTLTSVSEIAANACSKALCNLAFNPMLFEPMVLYSRDPDQANAWLDALDQAAL